MSASRRLGACRLVGLGRVRYRNRKGAERGLTRARQACARREMPGELWPVETFRCLPRDRGGCNGHHIRTDRRVVVNYLRAVMPAPVIQLRPRTVSAISDAAEAA